MKDECVGTFHGTVRFFAAANRKAAATQLAKRIPLHKPDFQPLEIFPPATFSKPILPTLFKEASETDLAAHFPQGRDAIAPKSGKRVREFMLFEHDVIHCKPPIDVRIHTVFVIIWCTTVVNALLTSSAPRNGSQWQS
jgi:hypothetical protein